MPTSLTAEDLLALQQTPDCELVDLILPDMNGLLRGKRITRSALEKIYADGVCLPMSLIATDITGNTVEETGLGYDSGDEDRICRPVPGTLRPVPWSPRPMAQLLLSMEDANGDAFEANPREVLKRVLDRYTARGLKPVIYEQAREVGELGVGINTLPHCIAELSALDLLPALDACALRTAG